jgi:preprotein translocase subunit SecG
MVAVVLAIHIVICFTLVLVILLQQGKGAEIGAVFGGSSQTAFGSSSQGNMMTKTTWVLATIFFATSIFLAFASTHSFTGSIFSPGGGSLMSKKVVVPAKPPMPAAPAVPRAAAPAPAAPAAPAKTAPQPKH